MNTKHARIQFHEAQIQRLQRRIDAYTPISNRYSWIRVGIFFGGLGLATLLFFATNWWIALIALLLSLLAFGGLAHFQGQIDRSSARHALWLHIKAAHVARMKLDWDHIPPQPETTPRPGHPFEYDLDITGPHSIYRLINTTISREGGQRLLNWLLQTTPDFPTIQKRQEIVRELTPMTRFRDRLTLNALIASNRLKEQVEGQRLLNWLQEQDLKSSVRSLLWISAGLNILTVVLFVLWFFALLPQLWIYPLVAVVLLFFITASKRGDLFEDATYLRYGFSTLHTIFSYLETYPYAKNSQLKALCEPFYRDREYGPNQLLKGMARISSAATLKSNGLLWLIINAFVPWDFYYAYRLQQYKAKLAKRLPEWLDTWFELEALCSLATYAYLNPEYIEPDVTAQPTTHRGLFHARDLGHPLIPVDKKVTNNFSINERGEIIIITGSNMAGKSTFLRTLGVNLCIAYAGGPVDATQFNATLFRLFTCIRVTDSVTDGYSYFYAEVRRLRALLDALAQPSAYPLFFLVDEIFKGTNNRERLIGSRSFVHALVGKNCVGLISTHDLELVTLAETLQLVRNMHFREEVIDGQMTFDYILRLGPCPTTNALKIMSMEGLPIQTHTGELTKPL